MASNKYEEVIQEKEAYKKKVVKKEVISVGVLVACVKSTVLAGGRKLLGNFGDMLPVLMRTNHNCKHGG